MIGAAKRKSSFLPGLAALRLVLLLVVSLCLPETRVWGFAVTPQPALGVFESASPSSVGEFTTATAYDASGSPVAARAGAGAGDEMVDVYRVFGGDARAQGFSWTTVDPRTVSNFRDGLGLPSGGASGAMNSADFLIKGQARASDIIQSRSALPLDGNRGGLPELIIDPKNVKLNDFSVLNP
jgi:hypothetical protein